MLPISLITGFLGSGKTTFLEHLSRQPNGSHLLFLVNEFSALDVDGPRLQSQTHHVVALPGGSIFCRCLVTEFIRTLQDLRERTAQADPPFEGLVIEASGMANPKVLETLLRETRLDQHYRLASIITLVDPGSFPKLRLTLPTIHDQIESADTLLLNKVDCYPPDLVENTAEALREINSRATLLHTTHSRVALDLFPPLRPTRGLKGTYAPCRDPRYEILEISVDHPVDTALLTRNLHCCSHDLYRVKGTLMTPSGWQRIDYSASGLTIQASAAPASSRSQLVFLIRGDRKASVAEKILPTVHATPPPSP